MARPERRLSMRTRTWIAPLCIALLVAALGVYRASSSSATTSPDTPASESAADVTSNMASALPTILDFGRGECIPCQQMTPVLETLAERHEGRIEVRYLDLAESGNQEHAAALRVRVIPTQILIAADGTEVDRHEGFWALEEIETRIGELGWTSQR